MASSNSKQVALARPARPPVHVAQAPRIPAFLNKLYEMVNDEKTNHLIEWSTSGDSFFVFDQERFSREVLPHWFKHQNFASFVRQLNMYGFHKIPHLQQGVLKSEAESDHWNFYQQNFLRDQPDLLCLIQRKKAANAADDEKPDSTNAPLPTASNGQVLDIQSIVQGIAAIKRHQTTISAELSDLKRNNELLWQESEAARQRHQKQQDTINRIVKFLAGVFGHHAGSPVHKEDVGGSPPSRAVVPRKQSRLMIENGIMDPRRVDEAQSPVEIASIETPASAASPLEPVSPKASSILFDSGPEHSSPPADDSNHNVISTQPRYPQTSSTSDGLSITPSRSPTNPDFDTLIQGALSSLTPAQIQHLMNSISMPSVSEFPGLGPDQQEEDSSLMAYQPPLDFGQLSPLPLLPSPPQSASLLDKVDKSWMDTEDIEQDVDAVDSKINTLFQQFRIPNDSSLDPSALPATPSAASESSNTNAIDNELFHSFLNGLGGSEAIVGDANNASTAFLDEASSPSDGTISPNSPGNVIQEQERPVAARSTRKRKSDVTAPTDNGLPSGTRAKRRRER